MLMDSYFFRLLSQTTDGSGGNLKDNHKQFTTDPSTRYRTVPKKIDHDRILPLYDTDSTEEMNFLKEKFIRQQYYTRDEHLTLLKRLRKGVTKQASRRIVMPIRAAMAFRRSQGPGPQRANTTTTTPTTAAATNTTISNSPTNRQTVAF